MRRAHHHPKKVSTKHQANVNAPGAHGAPYRTPHSYKIWGVFITGKKKALQGMRRLNKPPMEDGGVLKILGENQDEKLLG